MFYQEGLDEALRFGDIVRGYVLTNATVDKPCPDTQINDYIVNVSLPQFSVVMTPCCSIEDKTIVLSPLDKISPAFFDNPYLSEDLTRLNRIMSPEQAVPPRAWDVMSKEEKQRRLAEGNKYAFPYLFIFECHKTLPNYTLPRKPEKGGNIETNYYMINFKNLYKVNCNKIISPKDSPLESKYLQLSIETREELRIKLAKYYSRVPKEDQLIEV